jgi:serine/threonine protein phosphatase PrpC
MDALPECNAQMRRVATMNMDLSGSTAIVGFISPTGSLTVASLGDSRCIVGECSWWLRSEYYSSSIVDDGFAEAPFVCVLLGNHGNEPVQHHYMC